jgi:hypothetical protein
MLYRTVIKGNAYNEYSMSVKNVNTSTTAHAQTLRRSILRVKKCGAAGLLIAAGISLDRIALIAAGISIDRLIIDRCWHITLSIKSLIAAGI